MSDTASLTSTAEQQRAQAKTWFESLRDNICAEVELLEREAPADLFPGTPATFTTKPWTRATGSGGGMGGFLERRTAVRKDRHPYLIRQRQADARACENAAGRWRTA